MMWMGYRGPHFSMRVTFTLKQLQGSWLDFGEPSGATDAKPIEIRAATAANSYPGRELGGPMYPLTRASLARYLEYPACPSKCECLSPERAQQSHTRHRLPAFTLYGYLIFLFEYKVIKSFKSIWCLYYNKI